MWCVNLILKYSGAFNLFSLSSWEFPLSNLSDSKFILSVLKKIILPSSETQVFLSKKL